jgi:hypothetical protein
MLSVITKHDKSADLMDYNEHKSRLYIVGISENKDLVHAKM